MKGMAMQLLPLFPLSFVLLPAMPLPLHIFEDRYKEMISDIVGSGDEFGVVLAKEDGIVNIGCTAKVERVLNRYEDGRIDLIAVGQRRFQIASLDQEKAYLRAEVQYFDDEDIANAPADLEQRAKDAYQQVIEMETPGESADPEGGSSRLSFKIGQLIRDLDKRQAVLSLRSEIERLEFLVRIMPDYLARQQRIALAKRVGPQNGHAKGL
jgi:Lon protease-like protein